jgi:hypothetical protein
MDDDMRRMIGEWMQEFISDQEKGELYVMVREVLAKLDVIDRRLQALERRDES